MSNKKPKKVIEICKDETCEKKPINFCIGKKEWWFCCENGLNRTLSEFNAYLSKSTTPCNNAQP